MLQLALNKQPIDLGRNYDQLMAEIHGRTPDGKWVTGVEVLRRIYAAIGRQMLAGLMRWPIVRPALDWVYPVFARNRLRLTGRQQLCTAEDCDRSTLATSRAAIPTDLFTDNNKST